MILALNMPFAFEKPEWLWLCLLVPVLVLLSLRSLAGLDPVRRVMSLILRSLVIVVLAAGLAEVVKVRTNKDLTVMFLMDRSDSVKEKLTEQEEYIRAVCEDIPSQDRIGVIDFARTAYLEQLPMEGGYFLDPGRLPDMPNKDRTDIAAAVRLAMAMFPHDTAKRIVILSDGNDNMGDVVGEAQRARADNVVIDVVPLWYRHRNEVYFDRMIAPTNAEEGEQVPLRMVLHSRRSAGGTVDLYHNGVKVELPADYAHVDLQPGNNAFMVKLPVRSGGPQRFSAVFTPDSPDQDTIVDNNRGDAFSFVAGRGKVLVVSGNPEHDVRLVEALLSENITVHTQRAAEGQMDLLQMLEYSCIVLANVPANTFTDEQHKQLASYVRDLGGGLIMTGGDESFGAGGWIGSPVADVMPVSFEIKHKRVIPRGALVLIMHSCEIPRGNFWGKEVAKKSVDTISSRDYIGVLAYSWSPGGENWEVPLNIASNKAWIKSRIDQMQIGDMPDFDATMALALKGLKATDAAQKHIIIISDGDPSPPQASILKEMKDLKITCSTIGIGYGSHVVERTLRDIATATEGRFYACRNPRMLPQIFVKESKIVRRPLIIDEPFQPQVLVADSEVMPGIFSSEDLPELGGLVLTSPKEDSRVQMPLVRATKDGNDPVLAHWQEGLGKAVAFTSGYWPRWGQQWTGWDRFAKLWAQIVRWSMRQEAPAEFETFTRIEGDTGRIVVEALDKDAGYLNFLQFKTNVIRPDQTVLPVQFTQTGPGHYEASFALDQTGPFIANVAVFEAGEYKGSIHTGAAVPFSPEFRELSTNEALLRQVADISGGRWLNMNPESDDVFSHDLPPTVARRPAWDWTLAWLLLPLFLLDVAIRRLASWLAFSIFVEAVVIVFMLWGLDLIHSSLLGVIGVLVLAELIGWAIRWRSIGPAIDGLTHTVNALTLAGARSEASLEQLKTTRDRVRDEQTGKRDAAPAGERADMPAPDAQARFDVGEKQAQAPVGDLHERLGGAKAEPGFVEKRRPPAPAKAGEEEGPDVTSRLLEAKRRARKDMEEKKDD
ncbi:MAG TPA: VWA domain-containing protein [Phycisphaerae bacterium]|nr:VWA domain-containing protein [Phycisphaerae bacterium]